MVDDAAPPRLVAIVAALRAEIQPVVSRLRLKRSGNQYHGQWGPTRLIAETTGIGAPRAKPRVIELIDRQSPDALMLVGFSGALHPSLRAGDLIHVQRVIDTHGHAIHLAPSHPNSPASPTVPVVGEESAPGHPSHTGGPPQDQRGRHTAMATLLTVNQLVCTPDEKRALGQQHAAAAVDMESFHLAEAAAHRSTPLTMVRAISDPVGMALPPHIRSWTRPDGRTHPAAVWRSLLRQPGQAPTLITLGRHARLASRALADAVMARLSQQLGPR